MEARQSPDRAAPEAALGVTKIAGTNIDIIPLVRCKDISIETKGGLDAAQMVGKFLAAIPVLVPANQGYVIQLSGNTLRVQGKREGIDVWELPEQVTGARVTQSSDGTTIRADTPDGELTLFLSRRIHSGTIKARSVERTTAPYRGQSSHPESSGTSYGTHRSRGE